MTGLILGGNSESIFAELDAIRLQQLNLAVKHVELERLPDEDFIETDKSAESLETKRNADLLDRKAEHLGRIKKDLETLGKSM